MDINGLDKQQWQIVIEDGLLWDSKRYPTLPKEVEKFITSYAKVETHDGKAWLLGVNDFQSTSDSAFTANDFEKMSLLSAEGDHNWQQDIIQFWNNHLPLYISVRNGYEYIAYDLENGYFVEGIEPEFEEVSVVASSISEFLQYITNKNSISG